MNNKHGNCCFIVPKYVREHLEKEGYLDIKESEQNKVIDEWIREQRRTGGNQLLARAQQA